MVRGTAEGRHTGKVKTHVGDWPFGEVREGLLLSDLTGRNGSNAVAPFNRIHCHAA